MVPRARDPAGREALRAAGGRVGGGMRVRRDDLREAHVSGRERDAAVDADLQADGVAVRGELRGRGGAEGEVQQGVPADLRVSV